MTAAPTRLMTTELQAELATLINTLGAFITQHAANTSLLPATTISAPVAPSLSANSSQPSLVLPQQLSALMPQGQRLIQMSAVNWIQNVVKNHIKRHLNVTQTFTSQLQCAVTQVVKEVLDEIPEFRGYKDPFWPIEAYIYTSLKSSRDCHKRLLKALQTEVEQAKENRPMEQARGFVGAEFEQAIGNTIVPSAQVGQHVITLENSTIVAGMQTVKPNGLGFAAWASAPQPFIPATSLNVPTAPLAFAPPVAPSSLHKAVAGIKSNGQPATVQMASNSKTVLLAAGTSSSDWSQLNSTYALTVGAGLIVSKARAGTMG
ncbi:hypothetical protein CTheo_7446 [Ceratobasidium theobromae]|uniref:Uncharacterized protein n=1 Tax=Ceratobasidium theobromae TaxID=1582974 RepID=A0A5N5QBF3_9AGAM|nr:hypothetical protein CTheo_7446 [Ceratobasidium theobromae]